jgi:hypothetical protein
MKLAIIALSTASLIASAPAVFAQGVSSETPGHEMQKKGSKIGTHGASGYAPGREMQAKGSKTGSPGASHENCRDSPLEIPVFWHEQS